MSRARRVSNISSSCTLNFLYKEMIYTFELTTGCKVYLIMDAGIGNRLSFVANEFWRSYLKIYLYTLSASPYRYLIFKYKSNLNFTKIRIDRKKLRWYWWFLNDSLDIFRNLLDIHAQNKIKENPVTSSMLDSTLRIIILFCPKATASKSIYFL